jgi:acyl carrier protein
MSGLEAASVQRILGVEMRELSLEEIVQLTADLFPSSAPAGRAWADANLLELGFDSLAFVRLFAAIEERLDIDVFSRLRDARDYSTLRRLHGVLAG